jgi:dihydroorotate dehydrogenase
MVYDPIYDPLITFEENYSRGPGGEYARAPVYKNTGEPAHLLFGTKVYAPFGVAAGPLFNSRFVKAAYDRGYDVAVYKTVRTAEKKCAPFPNIVPLRIKGPLTLDVAQSSGVVMAQEYSEPLAITNSFGVPSQSPDVWQPDMKKAVEMTGQGQLMIGAFQGTNGGAGESAFIKDHAECARLVQETGVRIYEVNTSCPNEGTTNLLCFDTDRMQKIVHAIKDVIGNDPLIVKVAYFQDDTQLRLLLQEIGTYIEGIAAINTIGAKVYKPDGSQALPGEGRLWAGVCGAPIKWAGIDMVARLKNIREEEGYQYRIIGVGGVTTPEDYIEYQNAGADCVLSATGMMWNPYLAESIKRGLK